MKRIYWQGSSDDMECPVCDSKHLNHMTFDVVEENGIYYDYIKILCETCSEVFEVLWD